MAPNGAQHRSLRVSEEDKGLSLWWLRRALRCGQGRALEPGAKSVDREDLGLPKATDLPRLWPAPGPAPCRRALGALRKHRAVN